MWSHPTAATVEEPSTSQAAVGPREAPTHAVEFLVVGGGIAGVTCAETLVVFSPHSSTLLLTESSVIKTTANLAPVSRYLQKFDVVERDAQGLPPSIQTVVDCLASVDALERRARTRGGRCIQFEYICLCSGGRPRLISGDNSLVLGIRDTDSVLTLQRRLKNARRVALVGNGGIACELAHELKDVEVHWIVKDRHIASTFVDPGAAHFFQQRPQSATSVDEAATPSAVKRLRYAELQLPTDEGTSSARGGAALGPDWQRNFTLQGRLEAATPAAPIIHYESYVEELVQSQEGALQVALSTGERIDCDFVVSATGVEPRHDFECSPPLALAADGGIKVDEMMATNVPRIYAAGDCCTAAWPPAEHWVQMRLWTQARQMGAMAGRSMAAALQGEQIYQDFCFELFGHVTQLFGHPVVLLGRFNGQDLGTDYEVLLRTTPGREYIKFVLQRGRLRGAILIGNTELAETCENLILNGIDLTPFGDDILNPDIDIEDYFD